MKTPEQVVDEWINRELDKPMAARWGPVEDTPEIRIDDAINNDWHAAEIRQFMIAMIHDDRDKNRAS